MQSLHNQSTTIPSIIITGPVHVTVWSDRESSRDLDNHTQRTSAYSEAASFNTIESNSFHLAREVGENDVIISETFESVIDDGNHIHIVSIRKGNEDVLVTYGYSNLVFREEVEHEGEKPQTMAKYEKSDPRAFGYIHSRVKTDSTDILVYLVTQDQFRTHLNGEAELLESVGGNTGIVEAANEIMRECWRSVRKKGMVESPREGFGLPRWLNAGYQREVLRLLEKAPDELRSKVPLRRVGLTLRHMAKRHARESPESSRGPKRSYSGPSSVIPSIEPNT